MWSSAESASEMVPELADRFDAGEELESLGFDVKKAQVELPKQCLIGHYLT